MQRGSLASHITLAWGNSSGYVLQPSVRRRRQHKERRWLTNGRMLHVAQCNWETEDDAPRINTKALEDTISRPSSVKSGSSRAASTVSVPAANPKPSKAVRISYLTEQTSHHPPVSAFYIDCPEKGLHAKGFDQITAKFTGTSIKVMPGEHNLGIFITLKGGTTKHTS